MKTGPVFCFFGEFIPSSRPQKPVRRTKKSDGVTEEES